LRTQGDVTGIVFWWSDRVSRRRRKRGRVFFEVTCKDEPTKVIEIRPGDSIAIHLGIQHYPGTDVDEVVDWDLRLLKDKPEPA
jgi:cupin superfamily acireductone dioxygenase involved in methionine salvage